MSRYVPGIATLLLIIAPAAGLAQTAPALVQRSYAVADLVMPLERAAAQPGKDAAADVPMGDRFVQLIAGTIEPTTWREGGGPGSVEFVSTTKTLIVNQTEAVHQKVAALLADLRQAQDVLVEMDVLLLTVCDSWFERIGVDFNPKEEAEQHGRFAEDRLANSEEDQNTFKTLRMMTEPTENIIHQLGQTFVNERQLRFVLEMAQGDRRSNFLRGPRITLQNGQIGNVSVGETQFFKTQSEVARREGISVPSQSQPCETGIRITAQPVVSPNRRLVHLYLKVDQKELTPAPVSKARNDAPQPPIIQSRTLEKTLAIPHGQTAVLLSARRLVEHRNEFGPPILSKVPYVNRLFKNVGYGRDSMVEFVLVTPRIVPLEGTPAPNEAAVRRGYEQMEKLCPGSRLETIAGATRGKPEASSTETGKAMLRELEPAKPKSDVVATLQKAYLQARAEGRVEEAEKLARALLAIDPNIQLQR